MFVPRRQYYIRLVINWLRLTMKMQDCECVNVNYKLHLKGIMDIKNEIFIIILYNIMWVQLIMLFIRFFGMLLHANILELYWVLGTYIVFLSTF